MSLLLESVADDRPELAWPKAVAFLVVTQIAAAGERDVDGLVGDHRHLEFVQPHHVVEQTGGAEVVGATVRFVGDEGHDARRNDPPAQLLTYVVLAAVKVRLKFLVCAPGSGRHDRHDQTNLAETVQHWGAWLGDVVGHWIPPI